MQKRFALSLLLAAAPALEQGIGALTAETKKATPFFRHFLARLFVEQVFRVFSVPAFSFERRLPFSCPMRLSALTA